MTGVVCSPLLAQPPLSVDRPGDLRPALPEFQQPEPGPELVLPPVAPREQDPLSRQLHVFARKFEFTGNEILSDMELGAIAAPYENRTITSNELQDLRHKLTLEYINRGYINSGVIIPDQKIADGVITLQVIEGVLSQIDVAGTQRLEAEYIRGRLALGVGPPLNINELQQRLQMLQRDRLIERINAELRPGTRRGDSVLDVNVVESRPYEFSVQYSNHQAPSVGAKRGDVVLAHNNLSGWGDRLRAEVGFTSGLDDYAISYLRPLNARNTTLEFRFERSDSEVVEPPFNIIDLESTSKTWGITLTHPFIKTPTREFSMSLALEKRRSETYLLGLPFSFAPGAENGLSKVTVLRFSQSWTERSPTQVIAIRSTFSFGLKTLGATDHNNRLPDGEFEAWLGQFQLARRLGDEGMQMIFRADMQLAGDELLSLEKFAVGGANSVRGYRENQLVRDNGFVASLEFRIPVFRKQNGATAFQLAPFVDVGRSWNKGTTPDPKNISSAGVGLRWDPSRKLHAELYLAETFTKVENPEHDLQDSGIHFLLNYRFF